MEIRGPSVFTNHLQISRKSVAQNAFFLVIVSDDSTVVAVIDSLVTFRYSLTYSLSCAAGKERKEKILSKKLRCFPFKTIQHKAPHQICGIFACWLERSDLFSEFEVRCSLFLEQKYILRLCLPSCLRMNDSNNIRYRNCTDDLFTK